MRTSRERFEELVVEALDGLPEWIRERLDNVDVLIEDEPGPGRSHLLGLYEGIPLTQRRFS
jgi:predicted Zn-dependent protease with MMP-like domain